MNAPGGDSDRQAPRCTGCGACSLVCPVADRMELKPAELVALADKGESALGAACDGIWECLDCRRCTVACGSGVDVYALVNSLRAEAFERGIARGKYAAFLKAFREVVEQRGRFSILACWRKAGLPEGPKGLILYRLMKGNPPLFARKVKPDRFHA